MKIIVSNEEVRGAIKSFIIDRLEDYQALDAYVIVVVDLVSNKDGVEAHITLDKSGDRPQ